MRCGPGLTRGLRACRGATAHAIDDLRPGTRTIIASVMLKNSGMIDERITAVKLRVTVDRLW